MATPLKDYLNKAFYQQFVDLAADVLPEFDKERYLKELFDESWNGRELKDRVRHSALVLHNQMPKDYKKAYRIIIELTDHLQEHAEGKFLFGYLFLADYVEIFGIDFLMESIEAMERITQFMTSEFAVRPFLNKYFDHMMDQMLRWSEHESFHVRRFASEGCRPRLPWALSVPELKKDPSRIIPILDNLKDDKEEFVRRSVANNLNDISKDHPEQVLDIALRWIGYSPERDWIVKHACRTLLKKGHPKALKLFDYSDPEGIVVTNFILEENQIRIGEEFYFSFDIENQSAEEKKLRIEYEMNYLRFNGHHSPKIFQVAENIISPGKLNNYRRKLSFILITTRRYYPGKHKIRLLINGEEYAAGEFDLLEERRKH